MKSEKPEKIEKMTGYVTSPYLYKDKDVEDIIYDILSTIPILRIYFY